MWRTVMVSILLSSSAYAQTAAIDTYLQNLEIAEIYRNEEQSVAKLLPTNREAYFLRYIILKEGFGTYINDIESLRLNEFVGASPGAASTTSLLSHVAVPSIIGMAVESGGILQQSNGTATTLRANTLGLARFAVGVPQLPECAANQPERCSPLSRRLRQLSASVSFESRTSSEVGRLTTQDLFGDDFRMRSWGVHLDLTPSNNLEDPAYIRRWSEQIASTDMAGAAADVLSAMARVFTDEVAKIYQNWTTKTLSELKATTDNAELTTTLDRRLEILIKEMKATDTEFEKHVLEAVRKYSEYFDLRDQAVRAAHTNKWSLEYANLRPTGELTRSQVRLVYSHQPTQAPVLLTLNFAASFYHQSNGDDHGRLRDIQFGAQIDRSLGLATSTGSPTFTLGSYYQWVKEDALITIPPGSLAPGTAIALPSEASELLNTKGHIGIVQAKLAIPVGTNTKIPISVTWSNRTELIKENDVRVQIGFTLDMDSLFR